MLAGTPAAVPPGNPDTTVLVDLTVAARPLLQRSRQLPAQLRADVPRWQPSHSPWLRSAMMRGQWVQTRRAVVRKWGASPLCLGARSEGAFNTAS